MDKLESSAKRFEAVSLRVEGSLKGLAVEVGPLFAEFLERVVNLGDKIDDDANKFRDLGKSIGFVFVVVLNIILTVKLAIQGVASLIIDTISDITTKLLLVVSVAKTVRSLLPGRNDTDAMLDKAEEVLSKIAGANRKATENIDQHVKETIDKLNDLNKPGKFAEEAEKKTKEIAKDTKETAKNIADAMRNAERISKGLDTFRQVQTPVEKFKDKIKELRLQLKEGAIDARTFGRAGFDALNQFAESLGDKQVSFAAAETYGSKEAYSSIIRHQFMDERFRETPEKRLERLMQEAMQLDRDRNKILEQVKDALTDKKEVNI